MKVVRGQHGTYQLFEPVGSGGQGTVYRGRDQRGALVAVKLSSAGHMREVRFGAEIDRMIALGETSGLAHSVVRVLDCGTEPRPFAVMEFFEHTLASVLRAQPPLAVRLDLLTQAALGVARLHAEAWVHGDVKPQNLLVRHLGPRSHLVLGDLGGCTKVGRTPPVSSVSAWYSSPGGNPGRPVALEDDLFSLAVVMYESLTGAFPHRADPGVSDATLLDAGLLEQEKRRMLHGLEDDCRVLTGRPDVLAGLLGEGIVSWIACALGPTPTETSAEELVLILRGAYDHLAGSSGTPVWGPVHPALMPTEVVPTLRRRRRGGWVGAAAAVAVLVVVGFLLRRSEAPSQNALSAVPSCTDPLMFTLEDADLVIGQGDEPQNTWFGSQLHTLADVNGDGIDELVVGARKSDPLGTGVGNPGATYVYMSPLPRVPRLEVEDATVTLVGAHRVGVGVMGALVDTAPGSCVVGLGDMASSASQDGYAWLLRDFEPGRWDRRDVPALLPNSTRLEGADAFYGSTVSLGYFDGDPHVDVFVGFNPSHSDEVGHIWFGPQSPGVHGVTGDLPRLLLRDQPEPRAGFYRSDFVDLSGDGRQDLVLSPQHTNIDFSRLYVLAGGDDLRGASVGVRDRLDGVRGIVIQAELGTGFGGRFDAAGDVDGDGFPDLVVGETDGARIVFGPLFGGSSQVDLARSRNLRIEGVPTSQSYDNGAWGVGDLDQDGFDDVVVCGLGAWAELGACWLVFGARRGRLPPYRFSTSWIGVSVRGIEFRNETMHTRWLGHGAVGSDLDGDGVQDLVLSAGTGVFVYFGPLCRSS
ncbi:MAG: FG-GAP repeat protein [Myxococcales bacterium]|nr:FG-GAP repeat protein [Myxococcales bacterium]